MIPLQRSRAQIFQYACHEGNLGLAGILAGSRAEETSGRSWFFSRAQGLSADSTPRHARSATGAAMNASATRNTGQLNARQHRPAASPSGAARNASAMNT